MGMPTTICPICGKEFRYKSIAASMNFPFCSRRCKLIDLGKWLEGEYVVPGSDEEDKTDEDKENE